MCQLENNIDQLNYSYFSKIHLHIFFKYYLKQYILFNILFVPHLCNNVQLKEILLKINK